MEEIEAQCQSKIGMIYVNIITRHNRYVDCKKSKMYPRKSKRFERAIDDLMDLYKSSKDYPFWRSKILSKADEYCKELIYYRRHEE